MKFKKFIKKNSVPLLLFVLLLAIVAGVLLFVGMFVPTNKNGVYGNRLDGIENNVISEETLKKVEEAALKNKKFTAASVTIKGRVVYLNLSTTLDRKNAATESDKLFTNFSESAKTYYDFQVIIKNESEKEDAAFVMFGARNHGAKTTTWTNYE